jgi:hypothetical protein
MKGKLPSGFVFTARYDYKKKVIDVEMDKQELILCRDCAYYEQDHFERVDGIPIITAHEICTGWGHGCKTSADGWCFRAIKQIQKA